MGRRKIEIRPIKDDRNRSVTFLKRKGGLFKKAHELSVLCSVDVAVFVFGNNKKLYEYSSADMSDLISRYQFHGGANEHKGPNDFNGGGDDDDDEDGDASPPQAQDAMDSQMMPPHYQGPQPPFPQIRHHTPSASPPIPNGGPFQGHPPPRGHTPQPSVNSRPGSRNDMRRGSGMMPQPVGHQPPPGGMNYMPTPPMYNQPHGQSNLMPHGPNYGYQQQPPSQPYAGDDRRPGPPSGYTSHPPPPPQSISVTAPPEASPQPPHQPLPMNPNVHISPPPQPDRRAHEPPLPAPMEPRTGQPERPPQPPLLNTDSAIKKMSRKSHSIFTPIEENRSILSQHLASFAAEPQGLKGDPSPPGAARAHSIDATGPARNGAARGSPPHPPRPRSAQNGIDKKPEGAAPPENSPTPPSRSNSFKTGSSASANRTRGPRLKVQIPDGASDAGDATGESTTPKAHSDPSSSQMLQRHNSHSSIVLPPPSPSASALLSAGATGPPNPFARPPPQQAVNGDTPVSSLPSRFMNSEFLPSPSSFYHDWNFRGSDNNTLPSPLNFATPVVGSGPSFLRDDNSANHAHTSNAGPAASSTSAAAGGPGSGPAGESGPAKRKSPEVGSGGAADSHDMSSDAKRVKVD